MWPCDWTVMQRRGIKGRMTEEGKTVFVGNREASSCSAKSMLDLHSDMTSDVLLMGFFFLLWLQCRIFTHFSSRTVRACPSLHSVLALDEFGERILQWRHMCDGPVSHWRWRKMQMLLFIYILHSLNLTKGLDNTMLVPYRSKYSSGTLFHCVLTDILHLL